MNNIFTQLGSKRGVKIEEKFSDAPLFSEGTSAFQEPVQQRASYSGNCELGWLEIFITI